MGDLPHRLFDGVDRPPVSETAAELVLVYPPPTPVTGLPVTDTEHERASSWHHHAIEAGPKARYTGRRSSFRRQWGVMNERTPVRPFIVP